MNGELNKCFPCGRKNRVATNSEKVVAMMGLPKKVVFQTLWNDQIGSDHPDYLKNVESSFYCL
jgi:hypothetical protein